MTKAKWVHKYISSDICCIICACGVETYGSGNRYWKEVDCPKCLAKRPVKKEKVHMINDPTPYGAKAEQQETALEKWEEWFKLCCDHSFEPQADEVWDGAIDTVCGYLRNELCSIHALGLSGTDEILNKVKKKFKTE